MQIKEVVLYSKDGRRRVVEFETGKLNIITGGCNTGKSALISIIDYCLGSKDFETIGVIADKVSWFGIKLKFSSEEVFIARQNPFCTKAGTGNTYIEYGNIVETPEKHPSQATTSQDGLISFLSSKLGIEDNLFTPPEGHIRSPFRITSRHCIPFCFQKMKELINEDILFYKQDIPFKDQPIKDALPVILGATTQDKLHLKHKYQLEKANLIKIEKRLREEKSIQGKDLTRGIELIEECQKVGLINPGLKIEKDREFIYNCLKKVTDWKPSSITYEGNDQLAIKLEENKLLRRQIEDKKKEIWAVEVFDSEFKGFTEEREYQQARLKSIGLFPTSNINNNCCPLCCNEIKDELPTVSDYNSAIESLSLNLDTTQRGKPNFADYIERLNTELEDLKHKLLVNKQVITALQKEEANVAKLKDIDIIRSHTAGKVSLWIDSIKTIEPESDLNIEMIRAKDKIEELESILSSEDEEERLESILNKINYRISNLNEKLGLEHSKYPIRFDRKRLTLIFDKEDKPFKLNQVGSAKNITYYHLLTLRAFHEYFVDKNRPVPRFLFLDQPSQIYFPKDEYNQDSLNEKDNDRVAVEDLYRFIYDFVNTLSPHFQIIVVDHANLNTPFFKESIIEPEWRDGNALVPQDW